MNSAKLDKIEALLRGAGMTDTPMVIILPDDWGGPGAWETVPHVSANGTLAYPASQAPPHQPGSLVISLPADWGKGADPNWAPPPE